MRHQQQLASNTAVTKDPISTDLQGLDEQIETMMTVGDVKSAEKKILQPATFVESKPHRETCQITLKPTISLVCNICNICGKTSRTRDALWKHKKRHHKEENVKGKGAAPNPEIFSTVEELLKARAPLSKTTFTLKGSEMD